MDFKDYYKILGVEPDADLKTIKTSYRKLARKHHPDVSAKDDAGKQFKEVAEAYEVLSDPAKRAEYDELRKYGGNRSQSFEPPPNWQNRAGAGAGQQGDFSDFFENIFGGGRFQESSDFNSRGRDIEVELPLFLEDTLATEARTIEYQIPQLDQQGRRQNIRKTLNVKIPAGVTDGERIRLKGQGHPGLGNAPAGDLYLRIKLAPHPLYDVDGQNMSIVVPVAPWEAALGTKITLPTLHGKISLSIKANSQSGQRLRIKGKGLKTRTGTGDLFAVLKVVMPADNDAKSISLWHELQKNSSFNPRQEWEA